MTFGVFSLSSPPHLLIVKFESILEPFSLLSGASGLGEGPLHFFFFVIELRTRTDFSVLLSS